MILKWLFGLSFLLTPKILISSQETNSKIANDGTEVREKMMVWSRQLGVTCVYCHNLDNFKDDTKSAFKVSVRHNQMVKTLQEEVFQDRDKGNALKLKVDCYMCHRGKDQPSYKEPPNLLTK